MLTRFCSVVRLLVVLECSVILTMLLKWLDPRGSWVTMMVAGSHCTETISNQVDLALLNF
jgi:hypothetical protein